MKALEQERQKVRTRISEKDDRLSLKGSKAKAVPATGAVDPAKLKKGDSVRIVSLNLKGTVNTLPDARGNLYVLCGILRTQTNVSDLVYEADGDTASQMTGRVSGNGTGKIRMSKSLSVSTELNLLGQTVDEAISSLSKYLDDAYIAHISPVRIVHGKGTGALRKAVHDYLRRQKNVADYHLGEFGEGDAGVTIVTFK